MVWSKRYSIALGVALSLLAGSVSAQGQTVFKSSATGNPQIKSIDAIAFGPNGLLLLGDSKGTQVVAVDTGDTSPQAWKVSEIGQIADKLAGRIGTTATGIEIVKIAVNPASGKAYVVIRKLDDKSSLVLTVDGSGKINEFSLEKVKYARVSLPVGDKAPVAKITDVCWADDRVLVCGQVDKGTFSSKIFSIPAPLENESKGVIYSTETYHVAHVRWETNAPIKTIIPYTEDGKRYVVGAFTCTPIVKYAIDDLKPGDKVQGKSVIELGNGNHPLDMFTYEKGGKQYILMNTQRAFGKQFGPSKYWTVRVEHNILQENAKINEKALRRLDSKNQPATDRAQMIDTFAGVMHMDRLDRERALVVRENGTLALLALP